jgi:hypothetical protein
LNLSAGQYSSAPYPPKPSRNGGVNVRDISGAEPQAPSTPTLRIETTTVDTDERKQMFGRTARHIITTKKETPLTPPLSDPQVSVTDGWYIDFDPYVSCDSFRHAVRDDAYLAVAMGGSPGKFEFIHHGKLELGYPVQQLVTIEIECKLPGGSEKQSVPKVETLVTQLERVPADPALFEIPAGFKRVKELDSESPAFSVSSFALWRRWNSFIRSSSRT